jgi:hypothetical protein
MPILIRIVPFREEFSDWVAALERSDNVVSRRSRFRLRLKRGYTFGCGLEPRWETRCAFSRGQRPRLQGSGFKNAPGLAPGIFYAGGAFRRGEDTFRRGQRHAGRFQLS